MEENFDYNIKMEGFGKNGILAQKAQVIPRFGKPGFIFEPAKNWAT